MENLVSRQGVISEAINTIGVNFSKDSASRKTPEYLEKRIDALDNLWAEYENNHLDLVPYEDKGGPYFAGNSFEKTKERYRTLRDTISEFQPKQKAKQDKATEPSGKIDELITRQRTNFRAFSRIIKSIYVDEITEKWELEDELRSIQSRWNMIEALHLEIDNILQGGDIAYEDEYFEQERDYKLMKRALNKKIASTVHTQHSTPQLDIPVFTGKFSQWPTFFDLYSEAIHNNVCLTNTQKMQHLKGKVRGEAERLISHLTITSENYISAWDILVHRFSNKQRLFNNQLDILWNQPSVQKQCSFELKRLHDISVECIHAIHNLGVDTNTWDPILVYLISKKLDAKTLSDYKAARKAPRELPELDEFITFLDGKFTALEPMHMKERETFSVSSKQATNIRSSSGSAPPMTRNFQRERYQNNIYHTRASKCPICNYNHDLYQCRKFISMSHEAKLKAIAKYKVCKNCLYKHYDNTCISTKRCKECNGEHNSLLHDAFMTNTTSSVIPRPSHSTTATDIKQHSVNHVAGHDEEILLTTVLVKILSLDGTFITLRALLDQGSQITLISEKAAQMLGLQRHKYHASVSGIGDGAKISKGMVNLDCHSIYDNYHFITQALVISKVINNLPNSSFTKRSWPHLQHLDLADPEYNLSRPVDLLLDASVYSDIILSGLIKGPSQSPIAQQTRLGWILSGNVKTFHCNVVINELPDISKYWEIEDISSTSNMSSGEQYCEEFYQTTTKRLPTGIYEVGLPMKPDFDKKLGSSKPKSLAQFYQLERKMEKNDKFAEKYINFMNEYQNLGQMIPVPTGDTPTCYLPHHGVLKLDSTTTDLRVVFNASSATSTGYSLNDLMDRGPNLQADLQTIIIMWRQHKYVMTADIEKMFRRIFIKSEYQPLQTILWRSSVNNPIESYYLTTVTYGTKAAPYLAMRTLQQLATDDGHKYPLGSLALQKNFYMDDYLGGDNSLEKAKEIQNQLINILKGAGMNIRKWSSNVEQLTTHLSHDQLNSPYEFRCSESRKTLGIKWNPSTDSFTFNNIFETTDHCHTKRQLLSSISKLFDPIGWISPLTIRAKLLFQRVWVLDLSWDDTLPSEITKEWQQMCDEFVKISQLKIPRHMGNTQQEYHLHGFCDASEKAYACAVYCVSADKGEYTSKLIASKTKLVPLNKKVSLPRLELCGALLLSELMKKITEALSDEKIIRHAWTDSMVVLGWINGDESRWKQFVARRVQQIKKVIPVEQWSHVSSEDNPADCATRGISMEQLSEHSLWWQGPEWLPTLKSENKPIVSIEEPTIETKKIKHIVNTALSQNHLTIISELLYKTNSITYIARTIAWVSRFITRTRAERGATVGGPLTSAELNESYDKIIKAIQCNEFIDDLNHIKAKGQVSPKSNLASFAPFVDDRGLLRVGGRLSNANISRSAKHPIILSSNSRLTELIINQAHAATLHGGARLTLSYIRQKYWIISGMRTVKKNLRRCIKCRRFNQDKYQPIMADLPEPRVVPSRPFTHTGVDFTGHVDLKLNKGRGVRTTKGYIAVFVCFSTKAVHLELVTDLSTPAFLAAFQRFCSRRGVPSHVYSDNGTNFVGANRLLKKEYREIMNTIKNDDLLNSVANKDISWHFNAPGYPSAGGLWESAVKSLKYHLKRVLGDQKLTYEEFSTLLHEVEACLNSRPLYPLTENPDDDVLTPGHFLIGGPLLSRSQPEPENINLPRRWQLVQSLNKQFWKRWSSEYLQHLQARSKWRLRDKNIEINDIVLLKEDNLPPGKWAMGRVQELHPGKDEQVRVVSVKTQKNIIKRPVIKLVPLLASEEQQPPQTEEQASIEPTPSRPQRKTKKGCNILQSMIVSVLLCLSFSVSPSIQKEGFNITELSNHQGLYFDKIANLQCIRDEWKLIVYYNMSVYWQGIRNIHQLLSYMKETYKSQTDQHFESIILQLDHELTEIDHYNIILSNNQNVRRQKRGLINGVGYIANALFGVLDERFADQYEKDIDHIKQNENHLQKLIHNQTIVMEAEYNILKRHEDVMNNHFSLIEDHINRLKLEGDRIRIDTNNALYFSLSSLASHIIITKIKTIQQTLINTVTDIYHGHISTHMLPPEQLQKQINIISGQLPADLVLPVDRSNIMPLYKLLGASARITDRYLIIEVKIPLLGSDHYELDRIITVPLKHEQNVHRIIPTFPYIGFNIKRDVVFFLSEFDLTTCRHASEDKLLCSLNQPVYDINIKQSICDIQLINSETSLSPCSSEVSSCRENWVRLHADNTWLFACCGECTVRIICQTGVTSQVLRGNGILKLDSMCTMKGSEFTIFAHNNYINKISINEKIEVPEVSILNKLINTSTILNITQSEYQYQDPKWKLLHKQIAELKEQSTGELNIHDIHHYALGYAITGVISAVGGIFAIRWLRARCSQRPTAAAPAVLYHRRQQPVEAATSTADSDSEVVVNVRDIECVPSDVRASVINVDQGTSPMISRSVKFEVAK